MNFKSMDKMKTNIKVAVIGVGHWGKNLLRVFNNQAQVVYVFHKDKHETTQMLNKEYPNIVVAGSYDEILRDKSLQAVVIATPTETHHDIAIKALKANKHIFLEKPGGNNYLELKEISAEAGKRNLKVALGYEFVHHPAARKLMALVNPNEITNLDFSWIKFGTFNDNPIPHLVSHAISIAKGLGIHKFEVVNKSTCGAVSECDIVTCKLRSESGYDFQIYINRAVPEIKSRVLVVSTKDKYFIWQNDSLFEIDHQSQNLAPIKLLESTALDAEVENFLSAIQKNKKPLTDDSFGLEVWKIIEKIQS